MSQSARPARSEPMPAKPTVERYFAHESVDPLRDAFVGQRAVHPFIGLTPVAQDAVDGIWQQITQTPRAETSVAYVHVPFCANHCLYCGFYQNAWRPADGPRYVDALIEQLRRDCDRPYQREGPIRAVYFGGGTPTLLAAIDLARAIEAVRTYLPLAADCEITIEGRARGFTLEQARAAFAAGANRLSLGVQTFDEPVRRRLGRPTPRRALIELLERLVTADQGAIVIDLIYGLPGQDLACWEDDVCTALALGLDGVDLYSLKVIGRTPLGQAVANGSLTPAPAESLGRYYRLGAELMSEARWDPLSSSHWRANTRERNLYNLLVKGGAPCLAIGAGAGGSLNGLDGAYSYRNCDDLAAYQRHVAAGAPVVDGLMRQSPRRRLFNAVKDGMERGHLDLDALVSRVRDGIGLDLEHLLDPLLLQWQRAGLLVRAGRWLDLTLAGRFWQVQMTQNLLDWLNHCLEEHHDD